MLKCQTLVATKKEILTKLLRLHKNSGLILQRGSEYICFYLTGRHQSDTAGQTYALIVFLTFLYTVLTKH